MSFQNGLNQTFTVVISSGDIESLLHPHLNPAGVDLVSEPVLIRFGNKAGAKFFCFKDPDGTFLELIEPYNVCVANC
jgi:hypothetical protein